MFGLRGSDSFIWAASDIIGNGVTGTVFKCRDKKYGRPYAAKVLNPNSELRPYEVRMRETEVLKKLSHPNIVQLCALEREHGSQATVIFMELCATSLHEVLEKPENANGMSERDYLDIIRDVSSGMEYLRDSNIVHRDVKPGNILRAEKEDGKYVYKITDFGTARELGSNDKFMSYAYGTEEYLHPDLYERAVMRLSKRKMFDSTVDLWSLGVTFYHLASGELPFQPYGGRQNKEVMFKMITEKKHGVISCRQDPSTMKIIYSNTLPDNIQISEGLIDLITPVLRGLLETDPDYMISHDDFFRRIANIVERKALVVFFTKTSSMHCIYLQPGNSFVHLQEALVSQIGVDISNQTLYHNYKEFKPDSHEPVLHYPDMTFENPLVLDAREYTTSNELQVKKIPSVNVPPNKRGSVEEDAKLAKVYSCLSYTVKREKDILFSTQKALVMTHDVIEFEVESLCKYVKEHCTFIRKRIYSQYRHLKSNASILTKLQKLRNCEDDSYLDNVEQKYNMILEVVAKLESEVNDILEKKILKEEWIASNNFLKLLPWDEVISADINTIEKIYVKFLGDRRRQVNNLEDLVHKYEKGRLATCYQRLKSQHKSLTEHRNNLHDQLSKWLLLAYDRRDQMHSLKQQLSIQLDEFEQLYEAKLINFDDEVNKLQTMSSMSFDFRKLEESLSELDCMPDLLSMVQEQEEKLKVLEDLDEKEKMLYDCRNEKEL